MVRLVQLTDTHLCRAPGSTLLGMDTDHSLQAVIDLVRQERPEFDLLLATGDLSDGGAREAYERLQDYFTQLPGRDFWLPVITMIAMRWKRWSMLAMATACRVKSVRKVADTDAGLPGSR